MKKRPLLLPILLLMLTNLACGLPGIPTPSPEPSPIPTITLAPIVSPATAVSDEPTNDVLPTKATEEIEETETPTATVEPQPEATEAIMGTAVLDPILNDEVFGPGQKNTQTVI